MGMSIGRSHETAHPDRLHPLRKAALTRRDLLLGAATLGPAALWIAGCSSQRGKPIEALDPRVPAILDATISVDMHTHSAGAGFAAVPKYDLAAHMKAGRMSALCLCHSADGPVIRRTGTGRLRASRDPQPGELYRFTLRRFAFMDDMVAKHGMRRALTPQDLESAKAAGEPALIGTIEGCHFMEGKLERIEEVYRRGIRHLQIVHYYPSDLGDQQTEDPVHNGLSKLGADVIGECNRLGIVVDVAHATYELVEQAGKFSTTPPVLSHTALAARPIPSQYSRLISKQHAKLMADLGGVIGVWPSQDSFPSLASWTAGIARMVDAAGIDHVGLGTDDEGGFVPVWDDYAELPLLADALLRQGFNPEETGKFLGGNYMRVFRKVYAARKV